MPWKRVESYSLGYSITKKQFSFYYTLAGENRTTQFFPTPQEFLALADVFRNEGPTSRQGSFAAGSDLTPPPHSAPMQQNFHILGGLP